MNEKIFAFWTYDSFPYVSCAPAVILSETAMDTDGFGRWGRSSTFAYRSLSEGFAVREKLEALRAEFAKAQQDLKRDFKARALEVLPELALTKNFGGIIQ